MYKLRPIFDTTEEAERLHDWWFSLPEDEQIAYRKQKHREELVDEIKDGSRLMGHLFQIAFLIAISVDLLWRSWNYTAHTFPTWHMPLVSLDQTSSICLLFGGAVVAVRTAIVEMRRHP